MKISSHSYMVRMIHIPVMSVPDHSIVRFIQRDIAVYTVGRAHMSVVCVTKHSVGAVN
jgi:hypothetical protein